METNKKVGVKGKVIHSQGRELIGNVMSFMEKEASGEIIIPMENVKQRVMAATGISRTTYFRIKQETQKIKEGTSSSYMSPGKTRARECTKSKIDDLHEYAIRRLVYNFRLVEKKMPTIKLLREKMIEAGIEFTGKDTTLRNVLHNLGFRWKKTVDNRRDLFEKHEIRHQRINYLRTICRYRDESRTIVYTDETNIHSSHTTPNQWSDHSILGVRSPVPLAKGKRLVIAHAGGENGFIPNASLIFQSGGKTGEYHDDMNYENYAKWLQEKLIPNLPPRSVLVIDNAAYHNVKAVKDPTSAWKKVDMVQWLNERSIHFPSNLTKTELYDLIKVHRPTHQVYKIDQLLAQHGHVTLRLPPHHPELNPIEKIWTLMKNWVAVNNVTFNLADVQKLTEQTFEQINEDEWKSACDSVKEIENEYIEKEHLTDDYIDNFIVDASDGESDDDFQFSDDDE